MSLNSKMTELAEVIRDKTKGLSLLSLDKMIERLNKMNETEAIVKVFDYDGTILFEHLCSIGDIVTLPDPPSHEGLTFQNWSSATEIVDNTVTIDGANVIVLVGAIYITDDGTTRLYINAEGAIEYSLQWNQDVANGVSVDWGDGSGVQTYDTIGDITTAHTYATSGDYVISLSVADDCVVKLVDAPADVLGKVEIGSGVTSIGNSVFYLCTNLESVTIPNSVTSIGSYAFEGCSSLRSVTIPNSVTSIEDDVFRNCSSLTDVIIPNSVTSINIYAFRDCDNLKEIVIPNGVSSLIGGVFADSDSLMHVVIPDSLRIFKTTGGSYKIFEPFKNLYINNLATWCEMDNEDVHPSTRAQRLYVKGILATDLEIPNRTTKIGAHTFYGFDHLTSVTIPDSVTSIGVSAFNDCSGLTSVTIGNGVTTIGKYAFMNCSGLTSITIPNSVTGIAPKAFYGLKGVYYNGELSDWLAVNFADQLNGNPMHYVDSVYINGETIEFIGDFVVPNGTIRIGAYMFAYFDGLTSIIIPDSVTSIGSYAFGGCSSLRSVEIGDSVIGIGDYAFYGCSSLTSVTIPDSVTSIGNSAFQYCSGLITVDLSAHTSIPKLGSSVFQNVSTDLIIKVSSALLEEWKAATNWSAYADQMIGV